jgi:predicted dehydrogenase
LTPPVAADGKVVVAEPDAHLAHAVAADNGEHLWSFTADGRVDSPPTLHRGLCIFGCTDGHVYCLSAADGQLAWRFRAAPEERQLCVMGQVESAWPVHGKDFRRMLDKEKSIDAVVVSTPDHTHAVVAAHAMKQGKHVYVETPLAHDVWEARELARLARETGVATQMGNERHSGPGIRRAVEMIWGGGLGPIREVHCWTNRPQWPQGIGRPETKSPPPAGLDWDLWLGPAPERGYDPAYHPYRWRGWKDFGAGALGAMGCQLLDVAFWGLELGKAKSFSVDAESTGTSDETYPKASTIRYRFPARRDLPPVEITWYDGGRQPSRPDGLPFLREVGSNGTIFVGENHTMMFGPTVFGTNPGQVGPRTIPESTQIQNVRPFKRIPPVDQGDWVKGNRHIKEWISACKKGAQPCANFQYAAPLTEMVLLGNVALANGGPIEWNSETMQIAGAPDADRLIRRQYRKGWSL